MTNRNSLQLSDGEWNHACDSYGKVQHSKKACVFTSFKTPEGDHLEQLAGRIGSWDDARVMAGSKDLYRALKYMNHVGEGYCICPLNDGLQPDDKHSSICADSRKALRKVESHWADPNSERAEIEWMLATQRIQP